MAVVLRKVYGLQSLVLGTKFTRLHENTRWLATDSKNDKVTADRDDDADDAARKNIKGREGGWISRFLSKKSETAGKAHSKLLSDKKSIFALYTHNIKPDAVDTYLDGYEKIVNVINDKKSTLNCQLVGSWTVEAGDLDQAIHLWEYPNGFKNVDHAQLELSKDQSYQKLLKESAKCLRSRQLQYLFQFSYWPSPRMRVGSNKYEFRSYRLGAGTMIEWGNNWAKGINYRRKNDEAFGGYFSQVGPLYHVYHFWCYKDLEARREIRDRSWKRPEWDTCVAYTVPLIRESCSRILSPTRFSPTQ